MQGLKPRISVEYLGKYTETHIIAYGIVADIFFARYSLLVSRCSLLEFNCVFLKYMFHCLVPARRAGGRGYEYSFGATRTVLVVLVLFRITCSRNLSAEQISSTGTRRHTSNKLLKLHLYRLQESGRVSGRMGESLQYCTSTRSAKVQYNRVQYFFLRLDFACTLLSYRCHQVDKHTYFKHVSGANT